MDRSSDDSPPDQPSKRSGKPVPPFIAPRTGEQKAQTPGQRRSTPLFVPPSMLPPEGHEIEPTPPPPLPPLAAAAPPAPPAPRETKSFEVENLEPEDISLRITGERPAIGDAEIDVIAYDDANGELRADAAEGKRPKVDGLELESTELTMEPSGRAPAPPVGLEIESFWAAEAFTPSVKPSVTPSRPSTPVMPAFTDPVDDELPSRRSTIESLRVEEVMPPRLPTPQSVRAVTPMGGRASTPMNAIRSMPAADVRTPRQLEALKEMEPWAVPSEAPAADPQRIVAEALERVARRIRAGEVTVPADANAATDENALSAALQALVRAPRR